METKLLLDTIQASKKDFFFQFSTLVTNWQETQFWLIRLDEYAADQYYDIGDDGYMDGPGFELPDSADPIDDGNFVESDDYVVQDIEGVRKVEKVRVNHANVAKKVDVKRLKKELWIEVESKTDIESREKAPSSEKNTITDTNTEESLDDEKPDSTCELIENGKMEDGKLSFKETVFKMEATEAQEDVSLAFYFICMLHLANEKGLKLENGEHGLNDFIISKDNSEGPKEAESSRSLRPKKGSSKRLSHSLVKSNVESDNESDFE